MTAPRLLAKQAFVAQLFQILGREDVPNANECAALTPLDLGFDSAAIIELVFLLEDLGANPPDEMPWLTTTLDELYLLYTTTVVQADVDAEYRPNTS